MRSTPGAAHTYLRRGCPKMLGVYCHASNTTLAGGRNVPLSYLLSRDGTFTQRRRLAHTHRNRGTRAAVLFDIRAVGLAMLELPYWLMIAGALLVIAGLIGVLVNGQKVGEVDPPTDKSTDAPHQRMTPLPSLLDSRPSKNA